MGAQAFLRGSIKIAGGVSPSREKSHPSPRKAKRWDGSLSRTKKQPNITFSTVAALAAAVGSFFSRHAAITADIPPAPVTGSGGFFFSRHAAKQRKIVL
jgi:hypothetical protein